VGTNLNDRDDDDDDGHDLYADVADVRDQPYAASSSSARNFVVLILVECNNVRTVSFFLNTISHSLLYSHYFSPMVLQSRQSPGRSSPPRGVKRSLHALSSRDDDDGVGSYHGHQSPETGKHDETEGRLQGWLAEWDATFGSNTS
jgi:hypothetical protein